MQEEQTRSVAFGRGPLRDEFRGKLKIEICCSHRAGIVTGNGGEQSADFPGSAALSAASFRRKFSLASETLALLGAPLYVREERPQNVVLLGSARNCE